MNGAHLTQIPKRFLFLGAALGAMGFVVVSALFSVWATNSVSAAGRMVGLPMVIAAMWVPVTMALGAVVGFGFVRYHPVLIQRPRAAVLGALAVLVGIAAVQILGDAWLTLRLDVPWSLSLRRVLWRSDAILLAAAVVLPATICGAIIAIGGASLPRSLLRAAFLGVVTAPVTLSQAIRMVGGFGSPAALAAVWGTPLLAAAIYLVQATRRVQRMTPT